MSGAEKIYEAGGKISGCSSPHEEQAAGEARESVGDNSNPPKAGKRKKCEVNG